MQPHNRDSQVPTKTLILAGVAEAGAFIVGVVGVLGLFYAASAVHDWLASGPWFRSAVYVALLVAGPPIAGGLALAWLVRRRLFRKIPETWGPGTWLLLVARLLRGRSRRIVAALALASYFATWVFGVPAVLTDANLKDLHAAKTTAEYYGEPPQLVYVGSEFAVPVLPGVIVFYHFHVGGGLHGWGGWKVYLWWYFGQRQLLEYPNVLT